MKRLLHALRRGWPTWWPFWIALLGVVAFDVWLYLTHRQTISQLIHHAQGGTKAALLIFFFALMGHWFLGWFEASPYDGY